MKRVPVEEKELITVDEAISHYDLIMVRFRKLLKRDDLSFTVRYFGNRTLIIRKALEAYLKEHPEERRETNGRCIRLKERQKAQSPKKRRVNKNKRKISV